MSSRIGHGTNLFEAFGTEDMRGVSKCPPPPDDDYEIDDAVDFPPFYFEQEPVKVVKPESFVRLAYHPVRICYGGGTIIDLLAALNQPIDAFESHVSQSRSILTLHEDWDDNGAPRFAEAHWNRVKDFLMQAFSAIWTKNRRVLPPPSISPVPDGSIDIHWKTTDAELLINVPSTGPASFYGDNYRTRKIKGTLDLDDNDFPLLEWLNLAK